MNESTHADLICKFTYMSKANNIQAWVEMVREAIGVNAYESIKHEYRMKSEEKQKLECVMHCTPREKKRVEIMFQEDVGASRSICLDEKSTEELFCDLLCGIN